MITFYKIYDWLSKITHLSLHTLPSLLNVKNTKISLITYMKNYDFQKKKFSLSDPIDNYFECITTCDVRDGLCISRCVEILKENENNIF